MSRLTPRQRLVLDYITEYFEEDGGAPTFREIADHLGITLSSAFRLVKVLEKKGRLRRGNGTWRNIVVVDTCCPVCGRAMDDETPRVHQENKGSSAAARRRSMREVSAQ